MSDFVNLSEEQQDPQPKKDIELNNIDQNQDTDLESVQVHDGNHQEQDIFAYDYENRTYRRNFGKCIVFKFDPVTYEPKYTIGPHWPLFLIAFGFLAGCGLWVLKMIVDRGDFWKIALGFIINFGEIASYLRVALQNPGIVSSKFPFKNCEKIQDMRAYCHACQIIRKQNQYHCYDCDVCVAGYDHHCPWTGKCIAKGNLTAFYIFLVNTLIFMIYNILMALTLSHRRKETPRY